MKQKLLLISVIFIFIAAFFALGLHEYFNLEVLKAQKDQLQTYRSHHPFMAIAIYVGIYIISTALSLPGAATTLTLAGGAIFGVVLGTALVSVSSTCGATLSFLAARFLMRDYIQKRFKKPLKKFNDNIKKEGLFYLFTLRLVPAFPFFLVNILSGLTPLKVGPYAGVSMLSMLPNTIVYVNAGTQLANINSFKDILSPQLLISFGLIGVTPLLGRKIVQIVKGNNEKA